MAPFECYLYNYLKLIVIQYYYSACLSLCSLADFLILFLSPPVVLCGRTSTLVRCPGLSPLFLTATKTTGVYTNSSQFRNSSLATYRPHSRSFFHALTNCPFCNSFVFKFIDLMGGYGVSHFFGVRTFRPADVSMCFRAIHFFSTLAHSSAHSCSSKKPQLFYFQSIAHSLQKNTRRWGEACDAIVD